MLPTLGPTLVQVPGPGRRPCALGHADAASCGVPGGQPRTHLRDVQSGVSQRGLGPRVRGGVGRTMLRRCPEHWGPRLLSAPPVTTTQGHWRTSLEHKATPLPRLRPSVTAGETWPECGGGR